MRFRQSLRFSVTAKFLLIVFIIACLMVAIIPYALHRFFIEETYEAIEQLQEGPIDLQAMNTQAIDPRAVNHMVVSYIPETNTYEVGILPKDFHSEFLETVVNGIRVVKSGKERHVFSNDDVTIFYVVKKLDSIEGSTTENYLVSFVYLTYVKSFTKSLYIHLSSFIWLIIVLTILISVFFANSISQPLVSISRRIKKISDNNWDERIPKTRDDEIGLIEESLEEMRVHLKNQSKVQQEMFQNISHDLKTPIMIIQGYSQAILDGYIPTEDLDDTILSILEESGRLEKKVKGLLYINKLDQLYSEKKSQNFVDVAKLFPSILEPFRTRFHDIEFKLDLNSTVPLPGEYDEWRVAIENIIDNMTRFAQKVIYVSYDGHEITLYNDGEHIPEESLQTIFNAYGVGHKANFGLGLTITKKIVNYFDYEIIAYNVDEGGVVFKIFHYHKS